MRTPQVDPLPGMSPLGLPIGDGDDNDPLLGDVCRDCGGPLFVLGTLGQIEHYRCRDCGLNCSTEGNDHNE